MMFHWPRLTLPGWRGSAFAWLAALLVAASGCAERTAAKPAAATAEKPATESSEPPPAARDVLERAIEAYHEADRYQDAGRLVIRYTYEGKPVTQTKDFSLAVAAPNRICMKAYGAKVVCDGRNLRATIESSPDEIFSVAAPDELSAVSVYQDSVLAKAMNQIVGNIPVSFFLDSDPLPLLLVNSKTPRLQPPAKLGDADCYRVRIDRREGALVLWIDQQTWVMHRVEYPAEGYRRLIEPFPGAISDMTIVAEHDDARLDGPIDESTFAFQVPPGATLVKRFDDVREGARIPKFELRALDGRTITRDSLTGKIAVLKFWQKGDLLPFYNDLVRFEKVAQHFADNDSLVFLAVSVDADETTDDELRTALEKADLSLPIARVDYPVAFRSFGLQIFPTTVVLGRDGTLQQRVVGIYPDQAVALPKRLDTLLAGGELTLEAQPHTPENFLFSGLDWQISDPPPEVPPAVDVGAEVAIAPRSEPKRLRRKRLWSCQDLVQPGNLLVIASDAQNDRVLAIEGLPRVAELAADGTAAAKHMLELPDRDDSAITFLRTSVDAKGHRCFLGSKSGVQQVHLFDADWKRLLSFPEGADHPGISDAVLADIDGDGELEMAIGYAEAVGVHCVTLDGHRLWRNPAAQAVLRLDVTEPNRRGQRQLLVAAGSIVPIDSEGIDAPPVGLADAFLRSIYTADLDGNGYAEWCAVGMEWLPSGKLGGNLALGLSPRGGELWRYSLPDGEHRHPAFEMVTAGDLLGIGVAQWVIAAADGSIHILAINGSLVDSFNYGAAPSGMAVATLDGRPALLVATDKSVEAWQFELPPEDEAESPHSHRPSQ